MLTYFVIERSNQSEGKCNVPEPAETKISASELLCGLAVEEEYRGDIYNRDLFKCESDLDGDGTWTRSKILIRDLLVDVRTFWKNGHLYVGQGAWYSPLDQKSFLFSADVEIDHLVSLKEALDSGAWSWSPNELQQFANDL